MILSRELDRAGQPSFGTDAKVGGGKDLEKNEAIKHQLKKGHHRSRGILVDRRPNKYGEIFFDQRKPARIPGETGIFP